MRGSVSGDGRLTCRAFAVTELMVAISILGGIGAVTFHLFIQHEAAARDRELVLEMQQSVRAVASMISDELLMAGQGVPVFPANQEAAPSEDTQIFLSGSDQNGIRFRSQSALAATAVTGSLPMHLEPGRQITVPVRDSAFQPAPGSHIFVWGPGVSGWTWIRARVDEGAENGSVAITPGSVSSEGGTLTGRARVTAESAISYRLSGNSVRRGELRNLDDLLAPVFSELSVGDHFTKLEFSYHDDQGTPVVTHSLADRARVREVRFTLEGETRRPLRNGSYATYSVNMTLRPRNNPRP